MGKSEGTTLDTQMVIPLRTASAASPENLISKAKTATVAAEAKSAKIFFFVLCLMLIISFTLSENDVDRVVLRRFRNNSVNVRINLDTDTPLSLAREFPAVQFCQVSLPTISLALPGIANLMKWMRRYMIDQMNSDYVKFARAEGLSEREIFDIHISKNAMISSKDLPLFLTAFRIAVSSTSPNSWFTAVPSIFIVGDICM